ncbi:unnamed protein product [Pleuronectes platessa]|uniref:Uncharacterized protein n=1 Tax=Pleuronectes platessa TaxID=8262 RepID=A0A9N7TU21_PLEPL|nr:unnamed protein product [Pleuronectes platessa]
MRGGGTQSLGSHAMCPPYCNECISLLKLLTGECTKEEEGYSSEETAEGGGRGRQRLVVKNSVLKSHLSCQRADTGHPGTRGLWSSEFGHWPSFPPPLRLLPPPPTRSPRSYNIPPPRHFSATPSHLFFTVILTSMNCPPPPPPPPHNTTPPSLHVTQFLTYLSLFPFPLRSC